VTSPTVRHATRRDVPAMSRTLGRAFYDDPVMMWMLPDADVRKRKLHKLFASHFWRQAHEYFPLSLMDL